MDKEMQGTEHVSMRGHTGKNIDMGYKLVIILILGV